MCRYISRFRGPALLLGFARPLAAQSAGATGDSLALVIPAVLLGLLLCFLLLRPFLPALKSSRPASKPRRADPAPAADPGAKERAALSMSPREQEELLDNARSLVRDDPRKTAELLRSWLKDDDQPRS